MTLFNVAFTGDPPGTNWFAGWFLDDPILYGWSVDHQALTVSFNPMRKTWKLTGNKRVVDKHIYHEAVLQ